MASRKATRELSRGKTPMPGSEMHQFHSQVSEDNPHQAPTSSWTLVALRFQPFRARAHTVLSYPSSSLHYEKRAGPRFTESIRIYQNMDGL